MKRKQLRAGDRIDGPSKDSAASLHDSGLRHFRSGRYAIAEERVRRALASDPRHADSLHLASLLHAQAGRVDRAIDFVRQAIHADQGNSEYFSSLGTYLTGQANFAEALNSYEAGLKLKPDGAAIWVKVGDLRRQQNHFEEALFAYDQALLFDPRHLDAADKSGSLLIELRRYAEALAKFGQADAILPGRSETLFKKGLCFQLLARLDEAAVSYAMALAVDARDYITRSNLGAVLLEMGKLEEAVAHLRKVIQLKPDAGNAFNNLGLALLRLKRFGEALPVLDRAVALDPNSAEAINNRGNALRGLGRADEALVDYDRALALKPAYANAHANRAACLDDLSRPDEALVSYKTALALKPDHGDAHWNFAINRLRAGDFKNGWSEAEWRWKAPLLPLDRRQWNRPLWLGSPPAAGKTLLLYNDQGLGDAIQFCRYIPLLAERGARLIVEADGPLKELLSGVAGVTQCVVKGETLPDHDFQCPLSSLPLAFGTTVDTIPSGVPYVSVGEHAKAWEAFLGPSGLMKVGIVWSGNPDHRNDRNRSIPLKAMTALFDVEAQFVSLQKNVREGDLAILRERRDILDAAPGLESFADTAALIQHLDLVISVDTSAAHLAGALGKPVWILLPYVPDYRWLVDRDDSPWYPTARLFRQTGSRDYAEVLGHVRAALLRGEGGKPVTASASTV
jgi:tetratricopeptide (TPR) repeat protein